MKCATFSSRLPMQVDKFRAGWESCCETFSHFFAHKNALDSLGALSRPWPHVTNCNQNGKTNVNLLGLRNGRHKNRDNRLINLNTKVVCKHRKLILFVKQSTNDYKQLANYEKMDRKTRSSTVKHSSSTKNCAGQKESRKRVVKWTKKCWPDGKQRFTGVGKKVYWVVG